MNRKRKPKVNTRNKTSVPVVVAKCHLTKCAMRIVTQLTSAYALCREALKRWRGGP